MSYPFDPREAFLQEINAYQRLEPTAASHLLELLRIKEYSRKETLLLPGQVNKRLHFVYKGLVRGYHIQQSEQNKDERSTSLFASESSFVISSSSFLKQLPSQEGFEALEDLILVSVAYQDLQILYEAHPTAQTITRMLAERYLLFLDERIRALKLPTGKKKYVWFSAYHPELKNRVQDNHVASYLGLSIMQLSRIKKANR